MEVGGGGGTSKPMNRKPVRTNLVLLNHVQINKSPFHEPRILPWTDSANSYVYFAMDSSIRILYSINSPICKYYLSLSCPQVCVPVLVNN